MHLPIAHLAGFEEDASEELRGGAQSGSQGSRDSESRGSGKGGGRSGKGGGSGDGGGRGEGSEGLAAVVKPPKDLPCPRCQSMNTKFCYYNNYSVNQPRHFCRNCQRYWTVGGTLRNVPIGGGSRKKPSRSRVRADPYYVARSPGTGSEECGYDDDGTPARHGQHVALAGPAHLDVGTYPDFPLHASQLSSLLQFALQGQAQSHNVVGSLQLPPFLDPPGYAAGADEEAELQAFYDQSEMMSTAAAMMGSGLWVPELEPALVALVHKAALWAEVQRLQSLARRAQAAAWADQERECKGPVATPPAVPVQQQAPNLDLESSAAVTQPLHHGASSLHRRPGFWETALMHSRPSKRPESTSQSTPPPWDNNHQPVMNPVDTRDSLSHHNVTMVSAEDQSATYSYESVAEPSSSSWASIAPLINSSNPENLSPFY